MNDNDDRASSFSDELIAYLDGQLNDAECHQLEQRLRDEVGLRELLRQHQEAWDLLDELPKTRAGDGFMQTTLEMVALSATGDVQQTQRARITRRRLFWMGAGLGAAAASLIGYLTVATVLTAPDRQLVRDLPVIENLDASHTLENN